MSRSKCLKILSMAIGISLQSLSIAPMWALNNDYPKPKDDIVVKGDVYADNNVFVDKNLYVDGNSSVDNTTKFK